jgi:ribosomal protein S18 acetylase RimI-like enzyme
LGGILLPESIKIREATISDSSQIKPLFIELQNIHGLNLPNMFNQISDTNLESIESEICNYSYFYVAINNDKIIGYMKGAFKKIEQSEMLPMRSMISLIDIIIEKKYRNMGIGKMMLSFLEEKAKEHGISSIEIPVYAFNKRASEFYENNGYHKYVERKVKEIMN